MERTPWRWTIERRGNFGERDLYIGRPPGPGPVVELLLPAGLTPAILVGDDLAAERARIRKELLEAVEEARFNPAVFGVSLPTGRGALRAAEVLAALDRICPEGKE